MASAPGRGDIVWLDFDPQIGHEQSGRRPALVVSPKSYNRKVGLCLVCPITSQVNGYPFEVRLPDGIDIHGVVLCDQIKSLDWQARRVDHIGTLPEISILEVLAHISSLLDPDINE
jgi:mRNA interferase MazF